MPRTDAQNSARYWFDRRTPGLSLLRADFTTHEYPAHIHDALMVAVTESGGSEIQASGVPDEAHSAALLVVNPGQSHSSRMNGSRRWQYRSFYLERSGIDDVLRGLGIAELPRFSRNMLKDGDLVTGFRGLHYALDGEQADELRRRELLVGTFGRLARRYGDSGGRVPLAPRDRVLLDAVIEVMRDRYAEHVTLADLAAVAGLTQFQLIGLFRKGTGMTPHAYLTQIRLDSARAQLRRATPIAEAAIRSGFYDQAALTRHFKRCYGITPLQFAQAARVLQVITAVVSRSGDRASGRAWSAAPRISPGSGHLAEDKDPAEGMAPKAAPYLPRDPNLPRRDLRKRAGTLRQFSPIPGQPGAYWIGAWLSDT